jgi:hypothetical protein
MQSTRLQDIAGIHLPTGFGKFWYLLNSYTCEEGEWSYAEMAPWELFITNLDGSKSAITQEEVNASKKTLKIHNLLTGGNQGHLKHIKEKTTTWASRMTNTPPTTPDGMGSI